MARAKLTFKQSQVTRALRATKAAGIEVARIEIEPKSGLITIVPGRPAAEAGADDKEIIL